MLKLGIYKLSHDTPVQRLWRRGQTAATLLRAGGAYASDDPERFNRLMAQISLASGVARTTARNRFAAMDAEVQQYLLTLFPRGSSIAVEDWAVSSGLTASEWYARLKTDYPGLRFGASDAVLYFVEATREREGDTFVVQPDGVPLQYIRPPFVVSLLHEQHWLYPVNRRVQEQGRRVWEQFVHEPFAIPKTWEDLRSDVPSVSAGPFTLRRLPMLHSEVVRLRDEAFRIRVHSVFQPLGEQVEVLRTMNILNPSYFDDARLGQAISAVRESLKDGGVWIVGRTVAADPPTHDATVYRKTATGWRIALRFGKGSEIEHLIAAL